MKEAIGGYFSLELPKHEEYHKGAIKLNNGRNCLEFILRCRKYSTVYIPYYTCEAVLEPFQRLGIKYAYYHINLNFEIVDNIQLSSSEALLYTNYFGLKQNYVDKLADKYGRNLIVDNTQAFYARPFPKVDTFYTCRKFFGVADGAYLYTDADADFELEEDTSYERMTALLKRIDVSPEAGYADFTATEESLSHQPIRKMSKLTERMMQSVDYEKSAHCRRENFKFLHERLNKANGLDLSLEEDAVPMVYPYLTTDSSLRSRLIANRIYVAKYWPNVESRPGFDVEEGIANALIPLPIDQRYGAEEMNHIIVKALEYVEG